MLDRNQTVANLILDHSECAEVLKKHHIDFCCRGDMTLTAAARHRRLDIEALVDELTRAISARHRENHDDPRALSTPRLVEHIVEKHHEYLRNAVPFVHALAVKVNRVHGASNPKLRDLEVAVQELSETLLDHLDEEERVLFPALTASEVDARGVGAQLSAMHDEHLAVRDLLERIRAATDDFKVPDSACNSYRTLFAELEQLERDTFTHIHLENHVLGPRFAPSHSDCGCR